MCIRDRSYTVQASENYKLSFGVKATGNFFNVDAGKLNSDPTVVDKSLVNYSKFSPNIGAGVYLHSDKTYIGISVPNFVETNRYNDDEYAIFKERINYYLIAGHVFDLNSDIKFKPALLTKVVEGAPLQVDVDVYKRQYDLCLRYYGYST